MRWPTPPWGGECLMAARGPARLVRARFERVTGLPIDSWEGLERLVTNDVPEGPELDYKLRAYDDPSRDKREQNDELRKDVTAFANAVGGVIVCGVSDNGGLPGQLFGLDGSLESLEGNLGQVIRSRVWPPLDGVEIIPVPNPASARGCLVVVVPASARMPHAVEPHGADGSLKYARRSGRHTEWLGEAQVADLYRDRFTAGKSQADRIQELIADLARSLPKHGWLLLALVPDSPGTFVVSREHVAEVEAWWDGQGRRRLDLLPPFHPRPASATAGPRRVLLSGSDGVTSVPRGVYAELHDDGAAAIATELDVPSPGSSFYLDHLVAQTLDSLVSAADFSVGVAAAGGYARVTAKLHFPEHPGGEIHAWDPSFCNVRQLNGIPREVETTHTIDIEAVHASDTEAVSATALVAGHLAQFFGEPDARYLTATGEIRVNHYGAQTRVHRVIPRATQLGVPVVMTL